MTRVLIAFLALLGLVAQAPAGARVSDARPAVGVVAAERTGYPVRAVRHSAFVPARAARLVMPIPLDPPHRVERARVAVPTVLPGIDRARE